MAVETERVALVTGASSGIGEAAAQALLAAGFTVYGTSRRAIAGEERDGVVFLPLDVTDDQSAAGAVREVLGRSGRIDVLVNNAGLGVAGAAEESSIEQARALFDTNLFGAMRMTRAVLPQMREQGSGRVINLSSVLGLVPAPFGALYAASKHAIEGYSESLDHEVREYGVRVLSGRAGLHQDLVRRELHPRRSTASRLRATPSGVRRTDRRSDQGRRRTVGRGRGHRRRGHRPAPEAALPGRATRAPCEQTAPLRALDLVRQADPQDQPPQRSSKLPRPLARAEGIKRAAVGATSATGGVPPAGRPVGRTVSMSTTHEHAPTEIIDVGGVEFAYRELGPRTGVPLVFLHHFTAVLDDWDPRVIDGIAAKRHVIAFDNRGIGASGGSVPHTIDEMAADAVAFIRALGYDAGRPARLLARRRRRAGDHARAPRARPQGRSSPAPGPAGGGGIEKINRIAASAYTKAALTLRDPRHFLFFNRNPAGKRAATDYMARLKERTEDRDKRISLQARRRTAQGDSRGWPAGRPTTSARSRQPVFVANGDNDVMVASSHSADLARRIPNAKLTIYPDSGHGGVFQYHREFVPAVLEFLEG